MESLRELFKIGFGPSSSHTMGPQRAASKIKEQYPNAEFYTDEVGKSYSEIVGKTVHSVEDSTGTYEDGATTGIMNEFYIKYSEAKSDEDFTEDDTIDLITMLIKAGLVPTRSEGRRAIEQGGVSIDGEKITDVKYVVAKDALAGDGIVLKKGKKKFNKIVAK